MRPQEYLLVGAILVACRASGRENGGQREIEVMSRDHSGGASPAGRERNGPCLLNETSLQRLTSPKVTADTCAWEDQWVKSGGGRLGQGDHVDGRAQWSPKAPLSDDSEAVL